eukprot:jgi/Botrbrau1/2102/Bobra.0093s0010.1
MTTRRMRCFALCNFVFFRLTRLARALKFAKTSKSISASILVRSEWLGHWSGHGDVPLRVNTHKIKLNLQCLVLHTLEAQGSAIFGFDSVLQ